MQECLYLVDAAAAKSRDWLGLRVELTELMKEGKT